jgi:hypothetical protein
MGSAARVRTRGEGKKKEVKGYGGQRGNLSAMSPRRRAHRNPKGHADGAGCASQPPHAARRCSGSAPTGALGGPSDTYRPRAEKPARPPIRGRAGRHNLVHRHAGPDQPLA